MSDETSVQGGGGVKTIPTQFFEQIKVYQTEYFWKLTWRVFL